jgi:hypothetical protein
LQGPCSALTEGSALLDRYQGPGAPVQVQQQQMGVRCAA